MFSVVLVVLGVVLMVTVWWCIGGVSWCIGGVSWCFAAVGCKCCVDVLDISPGAESHMNCWTSVQELSHI